MGANEGIQVLIDGHKQYVQVVGVREMYERNRCSCGSIHVVHIWEGKYEYDYCMDCYNKFNRVYNTELGHAEAYCCKYN